MEASCSNFDIWIVTWYDSEHENCNFCLASGNSAPVNFVFWWFNWERMGGTDTLMQLKKEPENIYLLLLSRVTFTLQMYTYFLGLTLEKLMFFVNLVFLRPGNWSMVRVTELLDIMVGIKPMRKSSGRASGSTTKLRLRITISNFIR